MSERMVKCAKLGKELQGLQSPPFPGKIGQKIYENISAEAWSSWNEDMKMKVLNEYRLNMSDPKDYKEFQRQMLIFLNLEDGDKAEVKNEERGRS